VTIITLGADFMAEIHDMNDKTLVWFSRTLRWSLGAVFISTGIIYYKEGAWPAILFGAVLVVTGFFRPRRCIDDNCQV
jgi:hypothetical protein